MMGGTPVIEWLRPGVGYAPDAAASMRRLEARLGRPHDCNSSYRDYEEQERMWEAWEAWVAGKGPKPPHARAIAPWLSKHCMGLADDSDDWTTPGYIDLAAEHGWIRTAASDPTEQHHFEYQQYRDQHYGEDPDMPLDQNRDYEAFRNMLQRALRFDVRPNGAGADWRHGPTIWERLNTIEAAAKAGVSIDPADVAQAIAEAIPDNLAAEVVDELQKRLIE